MLANPPLRAGIADSQGTVMRDWVKWFQDITSSANAPLPGPYASDTLAAQGGVNIGQPYYQASGAVVVRIT